MTPRGRLWGIIVLLCVLVAGVCVLAGGRLPNTESREAGAGSTPPGDSAGTVLVKSGTVSKELVIEGELRAVNSRTIFASCNEETKITYLPVEGVSVKAGDLLLELDSSAVVNKIKDYEEKVVAADAEMVSIKATHESALRQMEVDLSKRWLELEQAKVDARTPAELISRRDSQEYQLTLSKAKAEYEIQLDKISQKRKEQAAELQLKEIEKAKYLSQLSDAKKGLEGMSVRSPSDGMVIYCNYWDWSDRRKFQVGDVVWTGLPVVQLPDLKDMEVLAPVNEVDGPKLSPGQRASVILDSYPGKPISGSIRSIAQTAVKAPRGGKARLFNVVVGLDRTDPETMKPGMSAQIRIVVEQIRNRLLVPRSAIRFKGGGAEVTRIEKDDRRRRVAVTVLGSDARFYAVAGNGALKAEDRILATWEDDPAEAGR